MSYLEIINLIVVQGPVVLGHLVAILTGVIAICMLIPGDFPEKQLQSFVDLIAKFSKK